MADNVRNFTVNSLQQFYNKLNTEILPSYAAMSYVQSAYSYIINEIIDNEYVIAQTFNTHNDRLIALETAGYITEIPEATIDRVIDETSYNAASSYAVAKALNDTEYAVGMALNDLNGKIESAEGYIDYINANLEDNFVSQYDLDSRLQNAAYLTSETQADWNVTNTSSAAYIKNKPTIPSIAGLATESYVNTKVAGIVNSAPETLDTLNELAAALGNDPNFATTTATEIGTKVSKTELSAQSYVTSSALDTRLNNASYISSFTETDPTVPSYVKSITQANINAWNSYANVQADWNATSGDAYIKNKPTIPSISGLVSQTTLSAQSYVTTTALNTRLNNAGYISSIPSEYITQNELSANGYLTSQTKANWNETNSNSAAYIQNKPTIPTDSSLVHTTGQETINGKKIIQGELALGGSAGGPNSVINLSEDAQINLYQATSYIWMSSIDITNNSSVNVKSSDWSYIKRVGSGNSTVTLQDDLNAIKQVPSYSSADAGKILSVNSSGQLVWITPVSIYTGSGDPSNSQGNDGDIYLQS